MTAATATRLPFALQDRTRVMWASSRARDVWEPRIQAVGQAWRHVERESVAAGLRQGALVFPTPAEFVDLAAWAAERGLVVVPLAREGAGGTYAATAKAFEDGRPWHYRAAITTPAHARAWLEAWRASDDAAIGELLGFPACCREFFNRAWKADAWTDPTWPAAIASGAVTTEEGRGFRRLVVTVPASTPATANILLRWFGVRAVPHLPCAFGCQATAAFAATLEAVGRRDGFGRQFDDLGEMLAWPVEWSALHGIAEVRTPVAKLSTKTDATVETLVVRRLGDRYPADGARGTVFPFQATTTIPLTSLRSFRDGLTLKQKPSATEVTEGCGALSGLSYSGEPKTGLEPATSAGRDDTAADAWTDNGFGSLEAMNRSHDTIAAALGGQVHGALDLGCGNGLLLERLAAVRRYGVELDPDRARRAAERTRGVVVVGDLTNPSTWHRDPLDLVVLMPGRWLEGAHKGMPAATLARLAAIAPRAMVYAYGDWLTRYGSLERLAAAAGIPWAVVTERRASGVAAALLRLRGV